jgi:elongin-A
VYLKYKKEHKIEIERDREILRNTMAGLKKDKESHISKVVDIAALPKIPRDPRMRANNGGVPLKGKGFAKAAPSSLMWGSGSRTKMTDGASVLTKARREAKEITQRSKLSVPTNMLSGRLGQVKKAPEGMRNAYRTAAQPALKILAKHRTTGGSISGGIRGPSLEDREKRLRAAMAGAKSENPGVKQTYVGSSDDEAFDDDDDDEPEDLFGDTDSRAARSSRPSPPRKMATPVAPSSRKVSSSKPSDMISAMVSNKSNTQSPASSARPSPSSADSRSSTPRPKMMAPRKREVDIFSRKKPRLR